MDHQLDFKKLGLGSHFESPELCADAARADADCKGGGDYWDEAAHNFPFWTTGYISWWGPHPQPAGVLKECRCYTGNSIDEATLVSRLTLWAVSTYDGVEYQWNTYKFVTVHHPSPPPAPPSPPMPPSLPPAPPRAGLLWRVIHRAANDPKRYTGDPYPTMTPAGICPVSRSGDCVSAAGGGIPVGYGRYLTLDECVLEILTDATVTATEWSGDTSQVVIMGTGCDVAGHTGSSCTQYKGHGSTSGPQMCQSYFYKSPANQCDGKPEEVLLRAGDLVYWKVSPPPLLYPPSPHFHTLLPSKPRSDPPFCPHRSESCVCSTGRPWATEATMIE